MYIAVADGAIWQRHVIRRDVGDRVPFGLGTYA